MRIGPNSNLDIIQENSNHNKVEANTINNCINAQGISLQSPSINNQISSRNLLFYDNKIQLNE